MWLGMGRAPCSQPGMSFLAQTFYLLLLLNVLLSSLLPHAGCKDYPNLCALISPQACPPDKQDILWEEVPDPPGDLIRTLPAPWSWCLQESCIPGLLGVDLHPGLSELGFERGLWAVFVLQAGPSLGTGTWAWCTLD